MLLIHQDDGLGQRRTFQSGCTALGVPCTGREVISRVSHFGGSFSAASYAVPPSHSVIIVLFLCPVFNSSPERTQSIPADACGQPGTFIEITSRMDTEQIEENKRRRHGRDSAGISSQSRGLSSSSFSFLRQRVRVIGSLAMRRHSGLWGFCLLALTQVEQLTLSGWRQVPTVKLNYNRRRAFLLPPIA
ncbi:hypothetical protein Bbelb_336800 [Branchiostoma belcheri]|nr:hypothetical protein Bbelb_336800 [Branchiostoma belcheri]